MKILYVAGREKSYSRTHNVLHALLKQDYQVVECFPPDRSFKHYPRLIAQTFARHRDCDLVLVGFYGQILLPFVRWLTGKPILFDMYIATYDTMVHDRDKARDGSFRANVFKMSDRLCGRLSQRLILETQDHIRDFSKKFAIPQEKFRRLFLAVDDSVLYPRIVPKDTDRFLVHFHGEYAPFHGVNHIVQAAKLLRDEHVEFQIVGRGITYERDRKLAADLKLNNIRFMDPVPYTELAHLIARADVCLGIFGENNRMLRVLTNKVIESIAMQKSLITGRNQPVQELLTHMSSAYLIERANPRALANAIVHLKNDPHLRQKLADGGYQVFKKHCTLERFSKGLADIIEEMVRNGN